MYFFLVNSWDQLAAVPPFTSDELHYVIRSRTSVYAAVNLKHMISNVNCWQTTTLILKIFFPLAHHLSNFLQKSFLLNS